MLVTRRNWRRDMLRRPETKIREKDAVKRRNPCVVPNPPLIAWESPSDSLYGLSSREPKSLNIIAVQGRNLIDTFSCSKTARLSLGYRYCLVVSASLAGENSGVPAENGLFTPTPNTRQTNS